MYYFYLKSKGEMDLSELRKAINWFLIIFLAPTILKAIALFIKMLKEFVQTQTVQYDILSLFKFGFIFFIIAIIIDIIKIYIYNKSH